MLASSEEICSKGLNIGSISTVKFSLTVECSIKKLNKGKFMDAINDQSQFLIYQSDNGQIKLDVTMQDETVWLTQDQMARLFGKSRSTITEHISNVYAEGELEQNPTCRKFRQVRQEGARTIEREIDYYNLDVIISVGYRVKSVQGTQFRIWATERLREYIVKGFALNDERFKTGNSVNYFDLLQERIREIRLSERFFYQKIKDIYTTSIDYSAKDEETIKFFKIIQNKLLWAISHQTAAELVSRRANAELPLMGMLSFDKAGKIHKSDVSIAKNYLNEEEIKALGLLVEQYLAFAEAQAQQRKPMYMKDWIKKLDDILTINERSLLQDAGSIQHKLAVEKAELEYGKYSIKQKELEHIQSLQELEQDLKQLKLSKKKPTK